MSRVIFSHLQNGDPWESRTPDCGVRGHRLDHLTNGPNKAMGSDVPCSTPEHLVLVHLHGFEPGTHWLRVSCSTNWAKGASVKWYLQNRTLYYNWGYKAIACINCRSSPRTISTGQLHTLLCLHLQPINQVVFLGPYSIKDERSYLKGSFTLRCLQRLSRPYLATQLCSWRNNWCTRGMSIPVLSY